MDVCFINSFAKYGKHFCKICATCRFFFIEIKLDKNWVMQNVRDFNRAQTKSTAPKQERLSGCWRLGGFPMQNLVYNSLNNYSFCSVEFFYSYFILPFNLWALFSPKYSHRKTNIILPNEFLSVAQSRTEIFSEQAIVKNRCSHDKNRHILRPCACNLSVKQERHLSVCKIVFVC